jgi:hypothetical protein
VIISPSVFVVFTLDILNEGNAVVTVKFLYPRLPLDTTANCSQ